jgi:hypothetical protein
MSKKNGSATVETTPEETAVELSEVLEINNIYDDEEKKLHKITPERRSLAGFLHQQLLMGALITAFAIKRIFDEKLYLELGCGSKEEYCETMLPFNRKQAYKYFAVAEKFGKYLPANFDPAKPLVEGENPLPTTEITKLYELTRLEPEQLDQLMDGESVGNIDPQNIHVLSANALRGQIKEMRKTYGSRVTNLEEQVKTLKEEIKNKQHLVAEAKQLKEDYVFLQTHFEKPAATLKEKEKNLELARKHMHDLQPALLNCNISADDPDTLQDDLMDLINHIQWIVDYSKTVYGEVLLSFIERRQ